MNVIHPNRAVDAIARFVLYLAIVVAAVVGMFLLVLILGWPTIFHAHQIVVRGVLLYPQDFVTAAFYNTIWLAFLALAGKAAWDTWEAHEND